VPPHDEQTDVDEVPLQTRPPAVQMVVAELLLLLGVVRQQVTPAELPQRAHTLPDDEQRVLGEVQRVPVETLVLVAVPVGQQARPGPPQRPSLQLPLLQFPGIGMQLLPFATQMLEAQQPPSLQALPEQQSCPGAPQPVPVVVTVPPVPEPPLPEPPEPALPPVPGVLVLPPEPPLPPECSPPEPPSPSPPVPGEPPLPSELDPLQPTTKASSDATATAEKHRMDDARLGLVMGPAPCRRL
jgi:hypothetical protein